MRTPKRCADKSKGKRKNHLVEIQADDHDLLVNSDNKNDDMLVYEFEKYSDDEDADGTNHAKDADETNHSDLKLRYFNVDLTVRKLIENKEIKADEEPRVKEADDKIKEGTLNLDDDTNAMTVVFGKEKEGYARGVGSGVK
nr:hypothetical protein [Tanacetum cinerariifolium]